MIRCQIEVTELENDKKAIESTAIPFVALRRLAFGELLARDETRWLGVSTPAELRCLAERVQREVEPGSL